MLLGRVDLDSWVLFATIMALVASVWISRGTGVFPRSRRKFSGTLDLLTACAITFAATAWMAGLAASLPPLVGFLALAVAIRLAAPHLSAPGSAWLAIDFAGIAIGGLWSALFVIEAKLPAFMTVLALASLALSLTFVVARSLERIAREALLTHWRWREPNEAPEAGPLHARPKVSIHLPCYAEPPEVVIATMNRLAALDYDNFEVLVCDNNTPDEALWRPLERHVATLNRRMGREVFRFFHVAPLAGAKAGALNFLLRHMASDAELVSVVDADYFSEPDFLRRLVPFFEDPQIAYVQTPHDYRDHEGSAFLTSCYWEYMPNNKVDMVGVHEYGGAFTIGTMCLLRTRVLKSVGGWAEWCLTEDSEVSVRLRAAGFRGIYIAETFGRGLIPDTYSDYKKQRFRWTAGPVQQLVRHWRLFLPAPWAPPMPGWTKLLEILRCSAPLQTLSALLCGVLVLGLISAATLLGWLPPIAVPAIVWTIMPLAIATQLVRLWHRYRLTGCARIGAMVRGEIARASLSFVVLTAGLAGLSSRPLAWRRTPKFGDADSLGAALAAVRAEALLGALGLALAACLFALHGRIGDQFGMLAASGIAFLALRFLCAPYMAWLAFRDRRADAGPVGRLPIASAART